MKQYFLSFLLLSPLCLFAQEQPILTTAQAIDALRAASVDQESDFDSAYSAAQKAGVEDATLLESKVLNLLGGGDLEAVLELIPSMESKAESFSIGSGGFFSSRAQVYGLIENLKALKARDEGDWKAFENHVKEGFWKSPEISNMFGMSRLVTERHESQAQQEAMADLRLPLDLAIQSTDGSTTTLGEMVAGQKAVLLDFWASWCGPCIALMPALKHKAEVLPGQGVFVAGMNTDRSDQVRLAREVQEKHGMDMPWLIEPEASPYSSALMINSIPRMILVGPEGNVLFNGHPMDPQLSVTLASLGVRL
ncbi:MAG: TlpA disulfide reductase family protein [Verrucomicrobia bacterium]|nr:TlpA disulfide reductase family protein [Verrucomicrobiota bacterium]MDA1065392.1 TlpA disulfide reductase family protein [Verrucomicrobiota bacterium]